MADVLACIDSSAYANSVCDHAGWFASDPDVGVEVLHVAPPPGEAFEGPGPDGISGGVIEADPLVEAAVWRLREEGVGPITWARVIGGFVEVASRRAAALIVMGKRGEASAAERRRLGANVDAMVRATAAPICLAPKLFLPIHRALVLLDTDIGQRAAVELVAEHPRLEGLPVDVVVMAAEGSDPGPKLGLARQRLRDSDDVFALPAQGLDEAVTQYMESRAADLIVVAREVVAPDPRAQLLRIEERGLWGARTPVLIC